MRKALAAVTVFVFAFFLCFTVYGVEDSSVVHNISPFAIECLESEVLNRFSETNEGWDSDMSNVNVTLSEGISAFPFEPLTDNGSLVVRTEEALNGEKYYVEKVYRDFLDLSDYATMIFSMNCTEVDGATYRVRVEMYSDADMFVFVDELESCGWNGVCVNLSAWEGRQRINKIKIGVSFESSVVQKSRFEYYIDRITLSDRADAYFCASIGAEYYDVEGGTVSYVDGVHSISGVGDKLRLGSSEFIYANMGEANSLKVDFYTEGLCQNVRLWVKRGGNPLVEECYKPVNTVKNYYSVYLPLSGENIQRISLVFEGVKMDTVRIYGISPCSSFFANDKIGIGIDTCVLNSGTEEVIIRGSVVKDSLVSGGEIYLFANELCDSVDGKTLSGAEPIAKTNISSDDFIFRIDYEKEKDERAYLYKKYTAALKINGEFAVISASKCVTNPETLADEDVAAPSTRSGKGVRETSISFMQEVGASDTAVWVDIGKFFETEESGSGKFECGGNLFYYNNEYFDSLNTLIKNYAEKDIDVTLVLVVSNTGNDALNRVMIHKDAVLGAEFCAYNTADRQGLMYLRAITEFFASRYCKNNEITRFVFGDQVANTQSNYNMGEKTLVDFITLYANGLRTVYNAARSYSPYVNVYTYIDSSWNEGLPFDLYTRYDNKAFLDSLDGYITSMGDIAWGLAHNPYPNYKEDYFSYNDTALKEEYFADRVGFKNIGVVINYLKSTALLYNNSSRDYIIIEKSMFSDMNEQEITADYVYNCYRALNVLASAYITDRSCNYNDAMKYVDTSLSLTASSFVSEMLGVATWESVIEGFSSKNIVRRNITSGAIMLTRPEIRGQIAFSDFSVSTDGWVRYGFTERLTAGYTFSERKDLISLTLGNVPDGESRGIVKKFDIPIDLSKSPILHFGLNIASLPTNVNYSQVTVSLISGNDVYEVVGRVKKAVWTELYCDFSAFSGINKVDSVSILFKAEENYYDSPQALISSLECMSCDYTDSQLLGFNVLKNDAGEAIVGLRRYLYPILSCVIIVSFAALVWRRAAKRKNKKA
ncbi:MAG: hypothetical protein IKU48_05370 [Clostridia bacterium]|nr:hypothetical protein [Clostridia bacterium]